MEFLTQLVEANSSLFIIINSAVALFLLLLVTIMSVKHANLKNKYKRLVRGMDNKNLEDILHGHLNQVEQAVVKVDEVASTCSQLKRMAEKSIQKVGIVRFNAFTDTGSDLSFAVALLDRFGDGVVLSSIFGRDDQRTYAKPIEKGNSAYHLSAEEVEAIRQALQ